MSTTKTPAALVAEVKAHAPLIEVCIQEIKAQEALTISSETRVAATLASHPALSAAILAKDSVALQQARLREYRTCAEDAQKEVFRIEAEVILEDAKTAPDVVKMEAWAKEAKAAYDKVKAAATDAQKVRQAAELAASLAEPPPKRTARQRILCVYRDYRKWCVAALILAGLLLVGTHWLVGTLSYKLSPAGKLEAANDKVELLESDKRSLQEELNEARSQRTANLTAVAELEKVRGELAEETRLKVKAEGERDKALAAAKDTISKDEHTRIVAELNKEIARRTAPASEKSLVSESSPRVEKALPRGEESRSSEKGFSSADLIGKQPMRYYPPQDGRPGYFEDSEGRKFRPKDLKVVLKSRGVPLPQSSRFEINWND